MKLLKKFIFILMISLLCVIVLPTKAASKDSATDPEEVSTYTPTESTVKNIYGMTHTLAKAKTSTKGNSKGQLINVFEMKTDGVTSKLVTWAVQKNNYSYTRADIIEAAKDYEEKHPGWIVTGGINADQYFFKFGNQLGQDGSAICEPSPYYPMITDGEIRFTVNPYNNSGNVVGIKNDGSANSFAYPDRTTGGYRLSIINEVGKELQTFVVNGVNRNAGSSETTVWCAPLHTGYSNQAQDKEIKTSNQLYLVENADLAYVSIDNSYGYPSGAPTSLFCKGTISNSTLKEYTVSLGQFAIETTNQEVINALKDGVKIKVEHLFGSDAMNNVDEAMGYHSVHMLNGVVQQESANAAYNTKAYSRAMLGKKSDGTYALITADYVPGVGSNGLNFTECNAVACYYDVMDLYQMDGGGSVTALARQDDGTFKITNYPKDSGNPETPRENLSYLFFVKRDPGVIQNQSESTHYSITLDKKQLPADIKVENLKVNVNGKEYDFNSEKLTIKDLEQDTTYKAKLTYNIVEEGTTIKDFVEINVTTKPYIYPTEVVKVTNVTDTTITFNKTTKEYANNISNIVLELGRTKYTMGSAQEYTCQDLFKDAEYVINGTYDIYDEASGKTFVGVIEEIIVKTKAFKDPTIEKFEESRKGTSTLSVAYEYLDEDRIVEKAYILVNGEVAKEVSVKNGSVSLSGLDFEANEYRVQLVLEYTGEDGETVKVESEILEYLHEVVTPEPAPAKKKCGKKSAELIISILAAASVSYIFLRKRK